MNLDRLQNWLVEHNMDAAYISNPITIAYFTGYEMEPEERIFALLTFKDAEPFIFCPALNVEEVKHSEWSGDVYGYLDHENPWQTIKDLVKKRTNSFKHWAIEENSLSVECYNFLRQAFNDSDFDTNLSEFIDHLGLCKTPEEIEELKAAGAEAGFTFQIGFDNIATGVTEKYIAGQISYQLKSQEGVMHRSFETITQVGENASNPYLGPIVSQIKLNELVLFDLGTTHKGYVSDSSRTVAYDEPSDKQKEVYEVDREVQQTAIGTAKPGITAAELGAVTRDIITKAEYDEYFIHRLGYEIGKNVHEFPSIIQGNDLVIEGGTYFSIEPGIHVPSVGGVRIEDCGVVTENGFEPFTKADKVLKHIPLRDKR